MKIKMAVAGVVLATLLAATPAVEASAPARSTPQVSVGVGCGGLCVYLTKTDQVALVSGGMAVLTAYICLSPPWLHCALVAGGLAVALVYISDHGFCGAHQTLRVGIYPIPGWGTRCVYNTMRKGSR